MPTRRLNPHLGLQHDLIFFHHLGQPYLRSGRRKRHGFRPCAGQLQCKKGGEQQSGPRHNTQAAHTAHTIILPLFPERRAAGGAKVIAGLLLGTASRRETLFATRMCLESAGTPWRASR